MPVRIRAPMGSMEMDFHRLRPCKICQSPRRQLSTMFTKYLCRCICLIARRARL